MELPRKRNVKVTLFYLYKVYRDMTKAEEVLTELMNKDRKSEYGIPTTDSDYHKALIEIRRLEKIANRSWVALAFCVCTLIVLASYIMLVHG